VPLTDDRDALKAHVDGLVAEGGTAGHLGIAWGWYLLSPSWSGIWPIDSAPRLYGAERTSKFLILMTDGDLNVQHPAASRNSFQQSVDLCDQMKVLPSHIQIFTVVFQAPSGVQRAGDGRTILEYCATSPGHAFSAERRGTDRSLPPDCPLELRPQAQALRHGACGKCARLGKAGAMLAWIPNALTISRCGFALLVLGAALNASASLALVDNASDDEAARLATVIQLWHQVALLAFIGGAITDFLDGWIARQLNATSRFGIWLDPIADKLLVGFALLGLAMTLQTLLIYIPAALIIARDLFMTWLRTRPEAASVVVPSNLAKVKTAAEMAAIGGLLAPPAMAPELVGEALSGKYPAALAGAAGLLILLWIAAALSLYTAALYVRAVRPK
jgi:CDP-diacylglycerol--glycerol-3-phosphate 3-phosphatidyltransferase